VAVQCGGGLQSSRRIASRSVVWWERFVMRRCCWRGVASSGSCYVMTLAPAIWVLARTTITPSRVHNYVHLRGPSSLSQRHVLSSRLTTCFFPSATPHTRYVLCSKHSPRLLSLVPSSSRSDLSSQHCKCASFFRPQGTHSLSNPGHFLVF
jgi:hypothetical protein